MKFKNLLLALLLPLSAFGVSTNKIDNLWLPGPIRITSGTPGAGKALTSDASGFGSWNTIATMAGNVFTQSNNTFVVGMTNTFNGMAITSNLLVRGWQGIQTTTVTGGNILQIGNPYVVGVGYGIQVISPSYGIDVQVQDDTATTGIHLNNSTNVFNQTDADAINIESGLPGGQTVKGRLTWDGSIIMKKNQTFGDGTAGQFLRVSNASTFYSPISMVGGIAFTNNDGAVFSNALVRGSLTVNGAYTNNGSQVLSNLTVLGSGLFLGTNTFLSTNFVSAMSIQNASPGISNYLSVGTPVTARPGYAVLFNPITSNQTALAVQGKLGQTGALIEVEDSTGTLIFQVSSNGRMTDASGISVATAGINGSVFGGGTANNAITVLIQGATSQTNLVITPAAGNSKPMFVAHYAGSPVFLIESNGTLNSTISAIMTHGGTNFITTFGSDQKNVAMGNESGPTSSPTTYSENTLYGYKSGFTVTNNSSFNTLIGSLIVSINGAALSKNTIIGESAGQSLSTAAENTLGGYGALGNGVNLNNNSAWGSQALNGKSGGNPSAAFGYFAGVNESTGGHNLYLGVSADGLNTGSNMVALGAFSNPRAANTIVLGRSDVNMLVGIMTNAPAANLHVNGTAIFGANGGSFSGLKPVNAALDFGTIAAGVTSNLTIACTGALPGDMVAAGWPADLPNNLTCRMYPSNAVIYVQLFNPNAVSSIVVGSKTYNAFWIKQ